MPNQAPTARFVEGFDLGVDLELAVAALDVGLHCVTRNLHQLGDLIVAEALGRQRQHANLLLGEWRVPRTVACVRRDAGVWLRLRKAREQLARDQWADGTSP